MGLSKVEWYPIVYDCLIDSGDRFDTLEILTPIKTIKYKRDKKGIHIWRVNYKTTQGNWSTGFGCVEVRVSELEKLVRDSKLRRLLNK